MDVADQPVRLGEGNAASRIAKWMTVGLTLYTSVIFLDSLRFKFTDHPNTQEIFGRLDSWSAGFGAPGLFGHTGLFSQYVIGSAELIAAALLLLGLTQRFRRLSIFGAALGLAVMSGAISFHLFTPLGTDPNNDGGGLFIAACFVWVSLAALLAIRRTTAAQLFADLQRAIQER